MTLQGRDIVCIGFSDWGKDILTNEQHLLVRLAERNRILYVESLGVRRPQLAGRDLRRMARRAIRGVLPARSVDGLHVLSPLVLPVHSRAAARRFNAWVLPWLVKRAADRIGLSDPLLWSFVPQAEVLLERLLPSTVLYYADDDHGAKPGIDEASFREAENRFAPRADAVLASAPAIVERLRRLNDNVHYSPNVADTKLFATALEAGPVDPTVDGLPRPRIVFIGAICASKIDVPLVVELARLRPSWSFAFVGPIGMGDGGPRTNVDALREPPNVHLFGTRPYEQLPSVLRGADAAIVPYLTGGAMRSVFPMKIYEYLAAGVPVVSTPLDSLQDVDEVAKAADAAAMAALLDDALERDSRASRSERSVLAQSHSWEARIEQIATVLGEWAT
jgi:glycosyltransferase involved in cell wall biosynthesis